MAKQGQHEGDSDDKTKLKGPNNPSKSVNITTDSTRARDSDLSSGRSGSDSNADTGSRG